MLNKNDYVRAADSALGFQKNGSIFGRLFSYMPSLITLAPGPSGYTAVRKYAMELHYHVEVGIDNFLKTANIR